MKEVPKYYTPCLDFGERENKISTLEAKEGTDDNTILWNLQKDFLQNKDKEAEAQIWQRFRLLCLKAVKKAAKTKQIVFDTDTLQYKADIATEYVMRRYRTYEMKGEVYIITNFVSAAYYGAEHAIFDEGENDLFLDQCLSMEELKI